MNEAETRADHIDPALTAAGWGVVVGVSLAPTLVRPLRAPLPSASRSRGVAPGSAWLAPFGAPASSARLGLCSGRRVPPPPTSRLGLCCGYRNSSAPKAHPNFSPGQRPGYPTPQNTQALKGRPKNSAPVSDFPPPTLGRPFEASTLEPSGFPAPTAHPNPSPGQRPGYLKGRFNPCHNPSRGCISTSSSAPKTANLSSSTRCAIPCTVTWRPFCKIWAAHPSSSTRSPTTYTSSLNWAAPSPSATLSNRSKRPLPNGSRHRAPNLLVLPGRRDTGPSPFPNPMSPPCVNTSPANSSITARNRFRKNIGPSSNAITYPLTKSMCGINLPFLG